MRKPSIILVTGLPGAGKTTLGQHLAHRYQLPFLYKDGIKETLYDALGEVSYEWNRHLGHASMRLLYHMVECLLVAGQSAVVEANFDPQLATPVWLQLKQQYEFTSVQIQCHAEGETLLRRFLARTQSGQRHPGHADDRYAEQHTATLLRGRTDHLAIGGSIIELDTTDFTQVNYPQLYEAIEAALELSRRR